MKSLGALCLAAALLVPHSGCARKRQWFQPARPAVEAPAASLAEYLNPPMLPVSVHHRGDFDPALSRDGQKLAFVSARSGNWDIWSVDLGAAAAPVQITSHSASDYAPAISPDGKRIAFITRREDAYGDLAVTDFREGERNVSVPPGQAGSGEEDPVWLDNRRIMVTRVTGSRRSLEVFDTKTGEFSSIGPSGAYSADVSPDGRWVIFTRRSRNRRQIEVAPRDGVKLGRASRLTELPFEEAMAVFGDGRIFLVVFADDTNMDGVIDTADRTTLWSVSFDTATGKAGRDYQALTSSASTATLPSAAGGRLIVTSDRSGQLNLWSLPYSQRPPDSMEEPLAVVRAVPDPADRLLAWRRMIPEIFGEETARAAHYYRAEELLKLGLWGPALSALERMIQGSSDYWARRAEILKISLDQQILRATGLPLDDPELVAAFGEYETGLRSRVENGGLEVPLRAFALLELGRLYGGYRQPLAALDAFRRVEAEYGSERDIAGAAALERAVIFAEMGEQSAAIDLLRTVVRSYGPVESVRFEAAERMIRLASELYAAPEDRIAALRRLELDAPDYLRGRVGLKVAGIYRETGQFRSAELELTAIRGLYLADPALRKDWAPALIALAIQSGESRILLEHQQELAGAGPEAATAMVDALLYLAARLPPDTEAQRRPLIELALRIDPDCPEAHYALGFSPATEHEPARSPDTLPPVRDEATRRYVAALEAWRQDRSKRGAERAISHLEDALAFRFDRPDLHHFLGYLYQMLEHFLIMEGATFSARQSAGHLENAITAYQTALVYARQGRQPERERELELAIGLAFLDFPAPNYRDASEFLGRYFRSGGSPRDERRALLLADRWMRTLFHVERFEEAVGAARMALEMARKAGDRRFELAITGYLGLIYQATEQPPEAVQAFEAAGALAEELGETGSEHILARNLAIERYRMGDHAGTLRELERWELALSRNAKATDRRAGASPATFAIKLGVTATDAPWGFSVRDETRLGETWRSRAMEAVGDREGAIAAAKRMLEVKPAADDIDGNRQRASALSRLGAMLYRSGDTAGALERFDDAYELAVKFGDIAGQAAVVASRMALLVENPGEEGAGLWTGRTNQLLKDIDARKAQGAAVDLRIMADLLTLSGLVLLRTMPPDADAAQRLLPLKRLIRARRVFADYERLTGRSTVRERLTGLLDEAWAFSAAGLPEGVAESLTEFSELASLYRVGDAGLWGDAMRCELLDEPAACGRFISHLDQSGPWQPSFLPAGIRSRALRRTLGAVTDRLYREAAGTAKEADLEKLVEYEERSRRISTIWTLGTSLAPPGREADRDLFREFREASYKWTEAVSALLAVPEREASGKSLARFRELQRAADQARTRYAAALGAIQDKAPELGYLLSVRPPKASDIQYDLGPDERIVFALEGREGSFVIMNDRHFVLAGLDALAAGDGPGTVTHWVSAAAPPVPVTSRYVSTAHYVTAFARRNINKRRGLLVSSAAVRDGSAPRARELQKQLETLAGAIPGIRGFFYDDNGPDAFVADASNLAGQYHFVHLLSPVTGRGSETALELSGGRLPVTRFTSLSGEPHLWVVTGFQPDHPLERQVFLEMAAYAGAPAVILGTGAARPENELEAWAAFYRETLRWQAPRTAEIWRKAQDNVPVFSRYAFFGYPGIDAGSVNAFARTLINDLANRAASGAAGKRWPEAALAAERAVTTMDVIGVDPRTLVQMLNAAVYALKQMRQWERAAAYEDRLARIYAEAGATVQATQALYFAGQDYLRANRFEDAFERFEDAIRASGANRQMLLVIESEWGRGLALAGQGKAAVERYTLAIAHAEAAGDAASRAELLFNRGRVQYEQTENHDGAAADLEAAIRIASSLLREARASPRPGDESAALEQAVFRNRLTLALVESARGRYQVAETALGELAIEAARRGLGELEFQARLYRATALRQLARPDLAIEVIAPLLKERPPSLAAPAGDGPAADLLNLAALLYWSLGREEISVGFSQAALVHARREADPGRVAAVLVTLGTSLRVLGQHDEARLYLAEAAGIDRQRENPAGLSGALRQLALIALDSGRMAEGRKLLDEAVASAAASGNRRTELELRWLRASRSEDPGGEDMESLHAAARELGDPGLIARTAAPFPAVSAAEAWLLEPPSSPATEARSGLAVAKAAIFRRAARELSARDPAAALRLWERGRRKLLRDRMWETGLSRRALEPVLLPDGVPGAAWHDRVAEAVSARRRYPDAMPPGAHPALALLRDSPGFSLPGVAPGSVVLVPVDLDGEGAILWWTLDSRGVDASELTFEPGSLARTIPALAETVRSQGRYEPVWGSFRQKFLPGKIRELLDTLSPGAAVMLVPDGLLEQLPAPLLGARRQDGGVWSPRLAVSSLGALWELEPVAVRQEFRPDRSRMAGANPSRVRAGFGLDLDSRGGADFFGQERTVIETRGPARGWLHCAGRLRISPVSPAGVTCGPDRISVIESTSFSASVMDGGVPPDSVTVLALRAPSLMRGARNPWVLPGWRRGAVGARIYRQGYGALQKGQLPAAAFLGAARDLDGTYGHPFAWAGTALYGPIASTGE